MNVIDFIRESALFMTKDRPDVYPDAASAAAELTSVIEALRQYDEHKMFSCIVFTSYLLARIEADGVEEFMLTRKLSSLILFEEEEHCSVYSHHDQINLPSVLDDQDED